MTHALPSLRTDAATHQDAIVVQVTELTPEPTSLTQPSAACLLLFGRTCTLAR